MCKKPLNIRSQVRKFNRLSTAKDTRGCRKSCRVGCHACKSHNILNFWFMILTKAKQHSSEQVFEWNCWFKWPFLTSMSQTKNASVYEYNIFPGTQKKRHAWDVILTICLIRAVCRTGSKHEDGTGLQDYRRIRRHVLTTRWRGPALKARTGGPLPVQLGSPVDHFLPSNRRHC